MYTKLECTCNMAGKINRDSFYGCKRVCRLHKWVTVQGLKAVPQEPEETVMLEADKPALVLASIDVKTALKKLFEKGQIVKGSNRRDYINRCVKPTTHYVIKSKKLARQLAIIHGYSLMLPQ